MEGEKGRKKMMTNLMMKRTIITSLSLGGGGGGGGVSKNIVKWSFILLLIIWVIDSNCVLFIL